MKNLVPNLSQNSTASEPCMNVTHRVTLMNIRHHSHLARVQRSRAPRKKVSLFDGSFTRMSNDELLLVY